MVLNFEAAQQQFYANTEYYHSILPQETKTNPRYEVRMQVWTRRDNQGSRRRETQLLRLHFIPKAAEAFLDIPKSGYYLLNIHSKNGMSSMELKVCVSDGFSFMKDIPIQLYCDQNKVMFSAELCHPDLLDQQEKPKLLSKIEYANGSSYLQ